MVEKDKGKSVDMKRQRRKLPTGRPPKLLIEGDILEQLTKLLRMGAYLEQACANAGVSDITVRKYLKRGRRELHRRAALQRELEKEEIADKTRKRAIRTEERARRRRREKDNILVERQEEPYVVFVTSVDKAMAEAEHHMLGVVSRAAAGGAVIGRTTRHAPDGTATVVERLAEPQWQAAAWRLERKHPERWGRQLQHSGAVGVLTAEATGQGTVKEQVLSIFGLGPKSVDDNDNDDDDAAP